MSCPFSKALNPCDTNFATRRETKTLLAKPVCNYVRKTAPNIQRDNFPSKNKQCLPASASCGEHHSFNLGFSSVSEKSSCEFKSLCGLLKHIPCICEAFIVT